MISDFDVDFIAEGIETHTEHSGIKSQNVRYAQGWFYSKALGAKEFTRQFFYSRFNQQIKLSSKTSSMKDLTRKF